MPFTRRPESLKDFVPGEDHDSLIDLVRIRCGSDMLYAIVYTTPTYGDTYTVDAATGPISVLEALRSQSHNLVSARQVRIDEAEVGKPILFSATGYDWRGIWRSTELVTELQEVTRSQGLPRASSDFGIVENR